MTERRHRVELAEKVRFLSDPAGYDDEPRRVEARETHMSWVFLTDTRVYKLKKPVRLSFLDFGTIARRRFFCEEELRLNRRLAARTYRQVVPLRRDKSGRLSLSGAGTTVDWLVEMERLPAADMLDECIRSGMPTRTNSGRPPRCSRISMQVASRRSRTAEPICIISTRSSG